MKLAKVPKVGDILKFKLKYMFTHGVDQYYSGLGTSTTITIGASPSQTYVEVDEGTLLEVLERKFVGPSDGMSDNFELILIVSVMLKDNPTFFRVNYSCHKDSIEILEPSKAIKLLYGDK